MKAGDSGPRREDWRRTPAKSRLAPSHRQYGEAMARHERAIAAGLSTYLDPTTGFAVMTADYLADRGYCCGQGCRHCPWESAEPTPP